MIPVICMSMQVYSEYEAVLHLLSSRHAWASVDVADGHAILFLLMDHTHEIPEVAIVFNNFEGQSAMMRYEHLVARIGIP